MPWSFIPPRHDEPELMDAPGLPDDEVVVAYRVLRRVNRQLGNLRSIGRELQRFLAEDGLRGVGRRVTALDVGSGSGDLPEALAGHLNATPDGGVVLALDRDPTAAALARGAGLTVVRGDALRLPFPDRSIDLVTAVKFAHHFSGASLTLLVAEMARVARHRVIVLDIRRHWLAYHGFIAWSRVFTRNRLVRHDGPLSVLRGFTATELVALGGELPGLHWEVRRYLGFQLALVGRRRVEHGEESRARREHDAGFFDVAVSGAGLAGGTLALRLARAGARVALVDAGRFPRDKLCGEFLSPECWGVLERLGLSAPVERLGYHPIRRVRITTPRGRALEAEAIGHDGRPGIGLSRAALDALVVATARAAGVEVFEGVRVGGPLLRDGRVSGLVGRRGADEPVEFTAAVTVAADGRHSALVARTGLTRARSRFRPRHFGLKCHLAAGGEATDMEPPGTVGLHLVPGGYVGACRVEDGRANLCGLLPESVLKRHRGGLDLLADDVFRANPVLDRLWRAARPASGWKTVAGVRVEASRPTTPGILYAGDCQGTIDPLGGQGMTMALLGAEMLAPFVERAVAARCASAALQAECDRAWHRRFDRRVRLCRVFHHLLVNPVVVDTGSAFTTLAPRWLAACFVGTRDRGRGAG